MVLTTDSLTAVNSTVVSDIVGYSSSSIAALGDISSDDLRQVLVKLVVPAPSTSHAPGTRADLFYWRLSFVLAGEATPSFLQGTVSCEYSDETSKLSQFDEDVKVALAIASASALDRQVYDLLASNKVPEARQAKREALRMLNEVASIDKSGFVAHLITLGQAAEASMADTTKVAEVKKAVYWTGGASIVHRKCF